MGLSPCDPSARRQRQEDSRLEASLDYVVSFVSESHRLEGRGSVVELLPSLCKVPGTDPSIGYRGQQ